MCILRVEKYMIGLNNKTIAVLFMSGVEAGGGKKKVASRLPYSVNRSGG